MSDPIHRELSVDGVRLHLVEQGEGPAVLLCHGYPECWYSWRHQLPALAAAGYRAIALDMRGYGESDSPPGIEDYTVLRLVGDLVGVLDALGIESAVVAGHDWGAVVAWHAALLRADRFPAVIALSVPFIPRGQVSTSRKLPETEHEVFYQLYFQEPGVAEADYERDTRGYLRGLLFATSGDMPPPTEGEPPRRPGMVPRTGRLPYSGPAVLPAWLGEADVDVYTAAFARNGFRGPLNWYRNIERNWQTLAAFEGRKVEVPALYIAGERDLVLA
ncbi:alpha/beta hydrolase, partial [Burkholderia gladioli]